MVNKRTVTATILFVLLVATIQWTIPSVSAEEPTPDVPILADWLNYDYPVWLCNPYVAGYDAGSKRTTTKVAITVSFPDTLPSEIPADNYIAAGMFLQGQESRKSAPWRHRDYGFLASLSLHHDGKIQYNMAFYMTQEPFPPDGHIWDIEYVWENAVVLDGVDESEPVTLSMHWNEGDLYTACIEWFYTIDGTTHLAVAYNPLEYSYSIKQMFYIGHDYESLLDHWWFGSSWYYYYQFGIYSKTISPIENSGWTARLEDPLYYDDIENRWRCVSKAEGIVGSSSYLDHWWRWGGFDYPAGGSYYENGLGEGCAIEFEWTLDDSEWFHSFPPPNLLWDNPPCVCVLAEDQYGNLLKNGDVYMDGQWSGFTGSSFDIEGTHMVRINDFWEPETTGYRYSFTQWEEDSTSTETPVTVNGVTCVTPRFFKELCPGDVDGNGIVDIFDTVIIAGAFGSQRGDPNWDSRADLVYDGIIDTFDMVVLATNFGKTY